MQITRPPAWVLSMLALAAAYSLWHAPGLKNGKSTMATRIILTILPLADSVYYAYLQFNPHDSVARGLADWVLAFGFLSVVAFTTYHRHYISEVMRQAEANADLLARVMHENEELKRGREQ